jgi:dipeptidyl-peptidase-4
VDIHSAQTTWMDVPGDPAQLTSFEWNGQHQMKSFLQQLNRKQNEK